MFGVLLEGQHDELAGEQPGAAVLAWKVAVGALGASVLMALGERLLLVAPGLSTSSVFTRWVQLPWLLACHWLPYAVAGVGLLSLAHYVVTASRGYSKTWRWLSRAALCLPVILAGGVLGLYAFSGREAQLLWYRPLGIAVSATSIATALAFPLVALSYAKRRFARLASVGLLLVGMALSLGLNRLVLPDEYEPLHVLLSVVALLYSCGIGAFLAPLVPLRRVWLGPALLAATLLVSVGSSLGMSRSQTLSFWVYSKSVAARYLGARLEWPSSAVDVADLQVALKPNLSAGEDLARAARKTRTTEALPHLIVVSIDNLQPDRVGAYGYSKHRTTPNIDAMAASGMLFERAYSCFPRTRMFLSSALLGRLLPPFKNHDPPAAYRQQALTLLLQKQGYHVLVKGWFDAKKRFTPDGYGVDTWLPPAGEDPRRRGRGLRHVSMNRNYRTIARHFKRATRLHKPAFAWMHFLRPHHHGSRFLDDPEFAFGDSKSDQYDSAIAVADSYLPELQKLAHDYLDPARPTYWVIVSDHGAGFYLHEGAPVFSEGRSVAEEFVHVPFIIVGPGIAPGRSGVLVSAAIDMAATLLDLAGVTPPGEYDGVSLLPVLYGYQSDQAAASRALYTRYYGWTGMLYGEYKLIRHRRSVSLVHPNIDPDQELNLADEQPALARKLQAVLNHETRRIERAYGKR